MTSRRWDMLIFGRFSAKNGNVWTGVGSWRAAWNPWSVLHWRLNHANATTLSCTENLTQTFHMLCSLLWNLSTLHDVVLRDVGMWRPHRLTGKIIMPWCEATDDPHLCFLKQPFYNLSYVPFFLFPPSSFFWVERVKSSDRLEVRASSNAKPPFFGASSLASCPVQNWEQHSNTVLSTSRLEGRKSNLEYSNRGGQHGSDNTVGLRPVHMSLLGSTRTCLSHAFQCFSHFQQLWEYAKLYLILLYLTLRERHMIEIWNVSSLAIVWLILIVGKAHWNDLNHLESVSKDIPPGFSQDLFGEWSCQSANTLAGRSLKLLLHHSLTFFQRNKEKIIPAGSFYV